MHCPASFRPIFSILIVSKVIPGSDGNLGNKVPGLIQALFREVNPIPIKAALQWMGKIGGTLKDIFERGVLGLEAYHPSARFSECVRLEKLAREIGFFVTAGSDFHGEKVRADRRLGVTSGNMKIDEKFYNEELLPALTSI